MQTTQSITVTTTAQTVSINGRFLMLQNIGTEPIWFNFSEEDAEPNECFCLPSQWSSFNVDNIMSVGNISAITASSTSNLVIYAA